MNQNIEKGHQFCIMPRRYINTHGQIKGVTLKENLSDALLSTIPYQCGTLLNGLTYLERQIKLLRFFKSWRLQISPKSLELLHIVDNMYYGSLNVFIDILTFKFQ